MLTIALVERETAGVRWSEPGPDSERPTDAEVPGVEVLAADVGGTFTDVVIEFSDGRSESVKVLSTSPDYERAILAASGELVGGEPIRRLAHGTTVATNALLEHRGARTALITTDGFRDVLELARLRRPSLFDIQFVKPPPLVPRFLRFEVQERTAADGTVLLEPSQSMVRQLAQQLRGLEVEAVAICLLNSYANPRNEDLIREWLTEPGDKSGAMLVSTSSSIQREIREFERTSTAVINAYVAPAVSRYLDRVTANMATSHGTDVVHIMQSNGSLITSDVAARFPCRLIESGPSAGVLAAAAAIEDLNHGNAIAFDMGGTTAKAALIEGGKPFEAVQLEVGSNMNRDGVSMSGSGYVIRAPSLDISEVGAGGGSIVWLDGSGAPRIGPRSAGSDPGPACYGAGGSEPTVTDANLILGYLSPDSIAGGRVKLDPELAHSALEQKIADPLGMDPIETAWGVHLLANAGMETALRAVSVERGRAPGDYLLVAYGGCGPMHAAGLAASFEMADVVIPPRAGLLCAEGLALAGIRQDVVRAYPPGAGISGEVMAGLIDEMKGDLQRQMDAGVESVEIEWRLAIRYAGQPSELLLSFEPEVDLDQAAEERVSSRFSAEHRRTYGYSDRNAQIEIVSVRAAGIRRERSAFTGVPPSPSPKQPAAGRVSGSRPVFFGPDHGWVDTPVWQQRDGIRQAPGPLIVEEMDATVVVPPGWVADCDEQARLRLVRDA